MRGLSPERATYLTLALTAVMTLVVVVGLWVAWSQLERANEALAGAEAQQEHANRLAWATLTVEQWLALIQACDEDDRAARAQAAASEGTALAPLLPPWDRRPAFDAMDDAVGAVLADDIEALSEAYAEFRSETDCRLANDFGPLEVVGWMELAPAP